MTIVRIIVSNTYCVFGFVFFRLLLPGSLDCLFKLPDRYSPTFIWIIWCMHTLYNLRWCDKYCFCHCYQKINQVSCLVLHTTKYSANKYHFRTIQAYSAATFGQGNGSIMLDDLNCNGYETDISDCPSNGWFKNDCNHWEDAGVSCS